MNKTNTKITPAIMLGVTSIFFAGTLLEVGVVVFKHQQMIESHKIVWLAILLIGVIVNGLDNYYFRNPKIKWGLNIYKLWLSLQGSILGLTILAKRVGWSNNSDFISYLVVGSIITTTIFWMYLTIVSGKSEQSLKA